MEITSPQNSKVYFSFTITPLHFSITLFYNNNFLFSLLSLYLTRKQTVNAFMIMMYLSEDSFLEMQCFICK